MMKHLTLLSTLMVTASSFTPVQRGVDRMPTSSSSSSLFYISTNFEEPQHYHGPMGVRPLDVLDMNISEESILRHYQEWCKKFHRRQDNFRFIVFQRNYLSQFKWNLAAGKQAFTLNEYADCTEEEYQRLMKNKPPEMPTPSKPSLPPAEQTLDVSVVVDENQGRMYHHHHHHEVGEGSYYDADVVDVEVVNHSPFMAGY